MIGRRLGRGLLTTGQLLAIVALAIAGGLMVWAVLPLAVGWSSHAVATGSMTPQVRVGDLLISDPTPASQLKPGMVVLFTDPSKPDRVLAHRIQKINDDATLITQGDANPSPDLLPVPEANVLGVAKLRIPWIGYPAIWFGQGRYGFALLSVVGLLATTALAVWPDRTTREDAVPEDPPSAPSTIEPWPWLVRPGGHPGSFNLDFRTVGAYVRPRR